MTTHEQPALCPAPEPPPLARAEHFKTLNKTRFKVEPNGNAACGECVWVSYEADRRGERAPLPRRARFHWGTKADRVDLCDGHKQMWEAEILAMKKAAAVEALKPALKRGRR